RTVVVIGPDGLEAIARPVRRAVESGGYLVHAETVPAGEAAKQISVAARLWSRLAAQGVTRSDAIVGVGGGATTDLAGFVAATWLRGVRLVLVPTTLLAIADAAGGGKTPVNTPQGKNLVGAVYPPAGGGARGPGRARVPARRRLRQRPGRGDQGGLHRRPGHPRPDRSGPGRRGGPARPPCPGAGRAGRADEGGGRHRRLPGGR